MQTEKHKGQTKQRKTLLEVTPQLSLSAEIPYLYYKFELPEGVSLVGLKLSCTAPTTTQIPIALYDPNGIRGILVNNPTTGELNDELWIAPDRTSKGGILGQLPAGTWTAQLIIRRLKQDLTCKLIAYCEFGEVKEKSLPSYPEDHVVSHKTGWFKGELHTHSDHSTGQTSLETVVNTALDQNYDFLSLTDHLTASHWTDVSRLAKNDQIVLLRSAEIAGHYGHANIHGVQKWVDPFVDRPGWSMNQVADDTHAQNGLFCINHPLSGRLGWRYEDFEWEKADLYEMFCLPEGPNNNLNAAVWDRHLLTGHKLVGVGSSDSHNPFQMPFWKLGEIFNWVYADELSEKGIVAGLKRGIVYASRGPEIQFVARNSSGKRAQMWESLPLEKEAITFEVRVKNSPKANLFVIKNGYPFNDFEIETAGSEWQTFTFHDTPQKPAYYRLELHQYKKSSTYIGITWRNHKTMLVISNPIWVGRNLVINAEK